MWRPSSGLSTSHCASWGRAAEQEVSSTGFLLGLGPQPETASFLQSLAPQSLYTPRPAPPPSPKPGGSSEDQALVKKGGRGCPVLYSQASSAGTVHTPVHTHGHGQTSEGRSISQPWLGSTRLPQAANRRNLGHHRWPLCASPIWHGLKRQCQSQATPQPKTQQLRPQQEVRPQKAHHSTPETQGCKEWARQQAA